MMHIKILVGYTFAVYELVVSIVTRVLFSNLIVQFGSRVNVANTNDVVRELRPGTVMVSASVNDV